ncbi:putative ribonuclease H-like domain-containing protein [Tanacetum coccineum]
MNSARPMIIFSKTAHSTVKRPINKNTTFKNSNFNQRVNIVKDKNVNAARPKAVVNVVKGNNVNAVKASACWVWKPKTKVLDHVSKHNSASITLKRAIHKWISKLRSALIVMLKTADPPFSQSSKSSQDDGSKPSSDNEKKVDEDPRKDSESIDQEKDDNVNSTNNVNAASANEVNAVDDEDVGAEANMNNLDTTIQVIPIPTTRIHKDHPLDQVIGDLQSAPQTRRMSKNLEAYGFMDVKSTFLYGKIKEEVYVCQPPGFEDLDFPNRVYKVEKALYGLHQAPKAWYETLSTYLLDNGFQRGKIDKTLFIKRDKGLQVKQKEDGIFISQYKYVTDILKKFGFTDVKTASTPMETQNLLLKDEDGEEVDVHLYRSMIGSLMYLTSSRPDIMFAVCACARYQVNPKVSHLHAVKRIFRYLKGQPKLGLWYPKDSPFDLVAYTDSDYARASLDRKSTTGGCQFLGSRLISWKCKKQIVVANSTTEAEYVAASSCCGQVKTVNGEVQLQALVDGKKIIVIEAFVRRRLQLNDEEGTDCLPNTTIFEELTRMRYEKLSQKLTFYKAFFSPQWKFLIHTILQCLSAKSTTWNEFSSTMASVIICLATNQKFNFLKYIFESMVKNLENVYGKFLMYPRFVQVFLDKQLKGMLNHKRIYVTPSHTKKIFRNIRRVGKGFSGRETPLFPTMMVQAQEEIGEGSANPTDPHHTPTIIQPSTSQPQKKQRSRRSKRKDTEVPQPSGPITNIANGAINEEMDDNLKRAATTATSLKAEQGSGNIDKTRSKATLNEPNP